MNLCTKDIVMFGDVAYKRWMSPIISILCSGEKFHKQNLLEVSMFVPSYSIMIYKLISMSP